MRIAIRRSAPWGLIFLPSSASPYITSLLLSVYFIIESLEPSPDCRNDRHADRIACHLIKVAVLQTCRHRLIKLFIRKALQTPALYGHKPSHLAVSDDTVSIANGKSKHRLVRLFVTSATLSDGHSFGGEYSPRLVLDKDSRMLTLTVTDARILSCGYASCDFG